MKLFLRRFFAEPPMELQDQAHITNLLLVFIIILEAICSILAVTFLILRVNATASAIAILATMFLVGLHVQIHRGYRQLVSWILPALIYAALVFAIYNYGSLRVSSLLGFAVVLILSALTIGENGLYVFGGLSAIGIISLYWMEVNGIIRPLTNQTELADLIIVFAGTLAIVALLRSGVRQINSGIKRARERALALDARNVDLERRASERTLELEQINRNLEEELKERKKAEEALRESEAQYRQLFNSINDAVMAYDLDTGRFADCNEGVTHLLDYTRDEFLSLQPADIVHPDFHQTMQMNQHRLNSGESTIIESLHQRKDGTTVQVEINSRLMTYQGARMILSVVRDITDRKRSEVALHESEIRYRAIVESTPDLICRFLPDTTLTFVNTAYCRYFGKDPRELVGMRFLEMIPGEDWSAVQEQVSSIIFNKEPYTYEHEVVAPTGEIRWQQWTDSPIVNDSGQVVELQSVGRDITEHKVAEKALQESERRFREMLQGVELAGVMLDETGRITFINDFLLHITGWSQEEAFGTNWFDKFLPEEVREGLRSAFDHLMAGEQVIPHHENEILTRGDERRLIRWNNTILFDSNGKIIGSASIGEDITERRRVEQALITSEGQLNIIFNTTTDMQILMRVEPGERLIAQTANRSFFETVKKLLPDLDLDVRGKERNELLKSFGFPVESIELETPMYHEAIRTKAPVHFVNNLSTPLGDRTFQLTISPIVDQQGTCTHMLWSGRDITEEKRAEEALRENQTLLAASQAIAHVGSWDLELPTKRLAWSDEVYRIFGVEPQEFDGTQAAFFEAVHPDDRAAVGEAYWSSLEQGRDSFEIEHRLVRKHTGEIRHVHEKCIHVRDAAGAVVRSLGMVQDITERKRAEEALRQNEAIFSSFLEHSPVYVFFKDKNIRTLRLSRNYEQMMGMPIHETIGKSMDELFPSPLAKSMVADDLRILKEGKRVDVTEELNGRVYETTKFPIFIDGQPEMLAGFTVDVTERKQIENTLKDSQRRLSTALRATKVGVWEWDMRTNQAYWSDENFRLMGLEPGVVESKYENWAKAVHPDDLPEAEARVAEAVNNRSDLNIEFRVVWPDGSIHWINDIGSMLVDDSGQPLGMYGIQMDITERKRMEELLFEEKERAEITLHSIGDAVITVGINELVEYLNPVAENLTGWRLEEATGQPLDTVFRIIEEASRQPAISPVKRCLQEGRVVGLANHSVLISRDGREYSIDDSAAPIRNRNGDMIGVVLVFHDVTEERRLSRKVAHDAMHDSLTGLVNRREFEKRLERALVTTREQNTSHILCYLDLDQFKIVNDTAGHAAGDELLRQLSGLLGGLFRQRDTFARLGGDEFGLLLENCQLDQALVIANEIKAKIRNYPFVWGGHGFHIGVSIGVVPVTTEKESVNQLLSQADVACYSAKDLGRDRIYVYHVGDSETTQRHGEIIQAARMRDAIFQDRFRLFCQPIVQVRGESAGISRYEILLRMADHDGRLIFPGAFIPSAERYGEMQAIDHWVIRESFLTMAKHDIEKMLIYINISGSSLDDESLPEYVLEQLDEFSIPPDHICFEITETAAIRHLNEAQRFIRTFRAQGGKIALDDFGSGFSSFRYLKTLSVDYVKIDGGFVSDMLSNPGDFLVVDAITKIAHTLGIKVIAEHASSIETIKRLREMGVDYAQGFGIGLPIPVTEAWKRKE